MRRTAKDNRDLPHLSPVEKIELSESRVGLRLVLVLVLIVAASIAFAGAVNGLFTPQTGWQTIQVNASAGPTCGDEFVFLYDLGSGGAVLRAESREVTDVYSDACRKAFQLFHTVESFEGVINLRDINLHPNETLTVDQGLYRAFETMERSGDRTIYLGPIYARYSDLFHCEDESQLLDFDPYLSKEIRESYGADAAYACDPQAVDLRLLGDNRVCLYVSEDYLAYAKREGIDTFLDFGWLKNAFIADYLADVLTEHGYTSGSISSYDGFSRCLDDRSVAYAQNIFDRVDAVIYPAAVMEYAGPMSVVSLRSYPINEQDRERFYPLKSGEIRTMYLDPADGLCRSAAQDLLCYSRTAGCAETALWVASVYVAEELDTQALRELTDEGVYSVYSEGWVIHATQPEIRLTQLYQSEQAGYTVSTDQ